ncbi:MAG TPA: phosphomannomutase/phosphoglucomutase [Gemmatimonadota bacterium]|nr:phosphomannomutase/phosphoglucomutase [Gemmatimonadota bacterium]
MKSPAHIFREYDVRGLVDEDLSDELVRALGRAFATFLRRAVGSERVEIALGRDVRPSSEGLRDALAEGMAAAGARVVDVGVVPTPVVYYACHRLGTDGGVMITGSHNPPEYNGFKLGYRDLPLTGEEIQRVRGLIEADDFDAGAGSFEERPMSEEYQDMVASRVELARPVKVVLDPANATGALFAADLLERVGAEVDRLFDEVDGTFPNHHPDPTVDAYVTDLRERVVEIGAELGIGLDGDCDRIGAVDETGRLVRGDQLTAVFARDQLERTPGERILFDVKSSLALEEDIRAHGGVPVMWKTGHSLAKQKMKADGIPFGGEMSGHLFFFHEYWEFDDAIFAACRLCEILSRSEESLAAMVDSLKQYHSTPEVRIETTEERKWDIVRAARDDFRARYPTVDIDGVRISFERGWALLRASNTQPVIVLRAEGETEAALESIKNEIETFLRSQGIAGVPWVG